MPYLAKRPDRKELVIVGSGWAGATVAKKVDENKFKVTVISPEATTPYTPLLASAACGLYDFSIVETPIRHQNKDIRYMMARATSVDFASKQLHCEPAVEDIPETAHKSFSIPYDYLVLAPGCTNNTFGTPGVAENALFVRTARDAKAIQHRIKGCFERASIPGSTAEEKKNLLHFIVVGAGPTGVEIVSEMSDLFRDDYANLYPHIKKYVRISIHDVAPVVLGMFDGALREYAMKSFDRRDVEVVTESHIEKVDESAIYTKELGRIPCGAVIWATGNKIGPFVEELKCRKPEKGMPRMQTDEYLHLLDTDGKAYSDVYALGDAADIEGNSLPTTAEAATQKAEWLGSALNGELFLTSNEVKTVEGGPQAHVKPFEYKQASTIAYLGSGEGIITGSKDYAGVEAWIAWRSKNFLWTRTWRQRVMVVVSWILDRFTGRPIAPK